MMSVHPVLHLQFSRGDLITVDAKYDIGRIWFHKENKMFRSSK